MPTGPPPSLPERVAWNLTLSFKAREMDRAGSHAHSSLDCREVCRLARWVHFTALQQYVSLLPGAVLCRGRGSLKLLAEAGPAVSLLPAASSPGAGRVLTVSGDGQVKRAPKSSVFQYGSLSSILRDSPAGGLGFLLDGEFGVGVAEGHDWSIPETKKTSFKKALLPFFN